ncbi:hypothetical protein FRX31_005969 [Thalictrum thalictroides]|uniref:Uncharacterized protein n=1 Tax=Thalictrum thalictroides TaxID=46969 RepID=A0A7J6X457_THATH|nr:hypothetical protein FRX31_005969 [Thalictrum thalictroides]
MMEEPFLLSDNSLTITFVKCRYVGNIHSQVTEPVLQVVFVSTGAMKVANLIEKRREWFSILGLICSSLSKRWSSAK